MVKIVKETNKSIEQLAIIDNIITRNELTQRRNGIYDFKFDCVEEELKSEYIQTANQVLIDDNLFDIKYIEVNNSVGVTYKVQCDHISYRLLNESVRNFALAGTPTQILTELLTGTDFEVGNVFFTQEIVFNVDRDASKIAIIRILANEIGGVLKFDNNGFRINIEEPVNDGKQARIKKNISSITKVIDNREELKTSYSIDLVNIFKSDDLIAEGFEDFEVLTIYDIINVIDEVLGIEVLQDVVEVKKDVIKDEKTGLMITNTLDDITDDLIVLKQGTVGKDEYIYGITINNDEGFVVERNDLLARSTFNAEEFKMEVGDGLGGYTDGLFFDAPNGEYKFKGNVIADSITIGSGSGIGNLIDAGALATLDTITGVYIDDNSITAPKINVTELSALSANLGTVNAGTINGVNINGSNIFGASIVGGTATFGVLGKVRLSNDDSGSIEFYDSEDDRIGRIQATSLFNDITFSGESGVGLILQARSAGITVGAIFGGNVTLESTDGEVRIQPFGGIATYQQREIATLPDLPDLSNYVTFGDLSGYATTSYVNSYAVKDLSAQGISLQYISSNNTVEVRTNGTYRGAFTLS